MPNRVQTTTQPSFASPVKNVAPIAPKMTAKMSQQDAMTAALNKAGASKLGIGGIAKKYR